MERKHQIKASLVLAEASGRTLDSVTSDTDRDHFMSAEEAKTWGIVDKVL